MQPVTKTAVDRWLCVAPAASYALFLAVALVLHVARPGDDPRTRYLSDYAVGRYGTLMASAFLIGGFGTIVLAMAIARHVATSLFGWLTSALVLLCGVTTCLLAVFPADPVADEAMFGPTRLGLLHHQLAHGRLVTGILAAIIWPLAVRSDPDRHAMRSTALAASVMTIATFYSVSNLPPSYVGIGQRIGVAVNIVWALFVIRALRPEPRIAMPPLALEMPPASD